ncbi:hypothetical protein EON63_08380 [archaeon]|nr:MAG: hypothetical protein EON63_08380 [archaeon]
MVWGCISTYDFHDLVLLDGTLRAILPYDRTICCLSYSNTSMAVQDNAAVHTAHEMHEFFHAQHLQVLDWPRHSPDLNIIEHVWHYLKEAMRGLTPARSKEVLWSNVEVALQYMWSEHMTSKIQTLYESLPRRMETVIAAHGGNARYY